jgi:hypothetical protein
MQHAALDLDGFTTETKEQKKSANHPQILHDSVE